MSLESQLHDKADKEFNAAYSKLFTDFEAGLVALIGRPLYDGHGRQLEQTKAFRPFLDLRFFGSISEARSVYDGVRDLYREQYIAKFLRMAEELAYYAGATPEQPTATE